MFCCGGPVVDEDRRSCGKDGLGGVEHGRENTFSAWRCQVVAAWKAGWAVLSSGEAEAPERWRKRVRGPLWISGKPTGRRSRRLFPCGWKCLVWWGEAGFAEKRKHAAPKSHFVAAIGGAAGGRRYPIGTRQYSAAAFGRGGGGVWIGG